MAERIAIEAASPAGTWLEDEPMRKRTSWRAGGAVARAYVPRDLQDLVAFIAGVGAGEPVYPVGLGSNLLVRDGGLRGTAVFLHAALNEVRLEHDARGDALLYAEAGVASPKVARFACTHGLRGAEFLAGIPGTVGGALAMNAGCYGSETWNVVDSVLTLTRDGRCLRRTPDEYEVGYRHVVLHGHGQEQLDGEIFLAARFRLQPGDGDEGRQLIKSLLQKRIASQPLELPNAGSVFRNPPGDHAARLIESCGLKGYRVGGAQVSTKHANFIVNIGGATAADIEAVIEHVLAVVEQQRGTRLVREVRIVGERM